MVEQPQSSVEVEEKVGSPYSYSYRPEDNNREYEESTEYHDQAMYDEAPERPKKKKKNVGKKIIKAFAGVAAVAVIAFSAIGVYTTFFEDKGSNEVATQTQQQNTPTVQTTASTGNELSVADINNKVAPSVVGITGQSSQGEGVGTGIIMTADGYIMTNAHVVSGMSNLVATLNDGTEYSATAIGIDTQTDLAVIKIEATGLTPAEFGDSDTLEVGEDVVAIGNPLGLDFAGSVTTGIISGLDREVDMGDAVMNYIQTNAAINNGNSGGPLVNSEGQVIGVNSAKINSTVAEGMGFAIPINDALPIVNELMTNGYVSGRPMIGIGGQDIDETTAAYNRVPTGVYITYIDENGAAANSGLQEGDIITSINGVEIASISQLNAEKNNHAPGDTVELTYYRMSTGNTDTVKVTLTESTGE
ncbi:MAG: trypsin-like peptidase domain-containing protein, partial [Bacillota bacterium]|nr:trypsin-like peptidase domain-containing protein [Bacillota bacterium]